MRAQRPVVPVPRTSLVGRAEQIAAVRAALAEFRLVTLVGPGGVGKTRVAGAVAQEAEGDVVWAGLGELAAGAAVELVDAVPPDSDVLLVLDGCERVSPACARVADRLLGEYPRLRILVTSREPVRVPGEATRAVPPLASPPAGCPLGHAEDYAAVRLLVERTRAVRGEFLLDESNVEPVGRICRAVGGLPLGIELAAARLRMMTTGQLADGLADMLPLLTSGPGAGLRFVLDRSYELLGAAERRMLGRLAGLAGSFDLAEAESASGADVTTLELLTALVDKSLVEVSLSGPAARYRLTEPVRQYALSRRPAPATTAEVGLRVHALGAATVDRAGRLLTAADWGYAKPRELFYLLVSSPPQTKEQLGASIWPDLPVGRLRNALHTALRDLRRALGDRDWIGYRAGAYLVDPRIRYWYDVAEFEAALGASAAGNERTGGRQSRDQQPDGQRADDDSAERRAQLRAAIALYRGDFLAGLPAARWAASRREGLRRAYEDALLALGEALAGGGRFAEAAAVYQLAVDHDPLLEAAHRELIRCLAMGGERARAVRHYTEMVERLRDELGVAPAAETIDVYRRVVARRRH